MRTMLLPLGLVTCIATAGLVPQQANGDTPSVPVVATLKVADTEQFCPTTWWLRIEVPAGTDIVSAAPFVQVERQVADGRWTLANHPPRGLDDPRVSAPTGWSRGSGSLHGLTTPVLWRLRGGTTETYGGELCDWRGSATPGPTASGSTGESSILDASPPGTRTSSKCDPRADR